MSDDCEELVGRNGVAFPKMEAGQTPLPYPIYHPTQDILVTILPCFFLYEFSRK
jgi:hypothetical protein